MEKKLFGHRFKKRSSSRGPQGYSHKEMSEDNPRDYEGKEHVHYKDPGYSDHHIRFPQDEPHMKSHVSSDEEHEAEDDFHMGVPDQTEHTLEAKIKRARMKMDAPDQEDPYPMYGNMTRDVGKEGDQDESGEEKMGPHDMQGGGSKMPKEDRKAMIVAVMKRKMKKPKRDESEGEHDMQSKRTYAGTRSSY